MSAPDEAPPPLGNPAVFERIATVLNGVQHVIVEHECALSTAHASSLRGLQTHQAAKCMVLKLGKIFGVCVLAADRSMDNRAVRHLTGASKLRFARRDELWDLTGLVPGCVPPFGPPVLPWPLWIDRQLADRVHSADRRLAFTPGVLNRSVVMDVGDWLDIVDGTVGEFSKA